ncbi:MAG TPA: Crp/Fnr family transcriptional regulator [Clostridia bacterium]|nr:Crp/Fnr family transcriptional regulator [Clostridia bacterium]
MESNILTSLATTMVFRQIEQEQLARILALALKRSLRKGEVISWANEVFPYVLLVEKGFVDIMRESEKGGSLLLRRLRPVDVFWGHAIIDGGPTPGTLKAGKTNTTIYLWHHDHLVPFLKDNPRATWEVMRVLMKRMRQASSTIDELAFDDVLTRLARLIVKEYNTEGKQKRLSRTMTLEQMAAMIGTSPEVVCRLLYRISNKEIIEITRTQFVIKDLEQLKLLANEE